jgi:hypothetical protein
MMIFHHGVLKSLLGEFFAHQEFCEAKLHWGRKSKRFSPESKAEWLLIVATL